MPSMNCGSGAFHGSCRWLASPPNFFGFNPSSRAICTWACESRYLLRASIHTCRWGGSGFAFSLTCPTLPYRWAACRRPRAMLTAGGSGRNGHRRPDACLARPPDSRLLNTGATAGAGPGSVEVLDGTLPSRLPTMIGWCGSSMACGLVGHRWRGVAQEGSALLEEALPSSPMNPTVLVDGGSTVGKVIIGTDPHKRSATIEVRDEREILLATGRFGMDKTGYRQLLGYARGVAAAAVGGGGRERDRTAAGRQVAGRRGVRGGCAGEAGR